MHEHERPIQQIAKAIGVRPTTALRFCLLGGFRILREERSLSVEKIRLRKGRDLLKLLALAPNHRLHREQLLELLWPEHPPKAAAHSLSQTLYKLRPKLLELDPSARVEFDDELIILSAEGGISTDVEDFEQAARSALSVPSPMNSQTAAICQAAIVAYTGDLLPEDGPSDLFYQRRDQLRQLYIDLILQLADYSLNIGEYLPAIDVLQKVIAIDPSNEEAHVRLMRAYALNDQRQAALRQYKSLEAALRHELEVDPAPESQQLHEQILNGELAPGRILDKWLDHPRHNLPAVVSSFIGREADVAQVGALVQVERLVTLTGAGGIGKTRLALKAAENLLEEFAQGVFLVDLTPLSDPKLVAQAVLDVFQLPEQYYRSAKDQLEDFLRERSLLLIMDNCEHLITGCASLAGTLLRACPSLHILATSRIRLNLPGEFTYYVPSLAFPDPEQPLTLTELAHYDAVRVFLERSGSYYPSFTLNADNASAVAQICQRLDGIPLALELAAARSRMMTVEQIAGQLKDALRLLVDGSQATWPRHRSLQASIEWSYRLLSGKERLLMQRLSIFSGGWGLDAAEAVCAGEEIQPAEVLDLLGALVDHSLVVADTFSTGEARFRMLETIHQYARERLVENDEVNLLSQRHLTYFLELAEQADRELRGPEQLLWVKRLELDRSNLTSAMERALNSPSNAERGAQLACALTWYWYLVGGFITRVYFMEKALSASADFGRTALRAKVLFHAGFSSIGTGRKLLAPPEALACLEESLEIWRDLGQDTLQEQAKCLLLLGVIGRENSSDDQNLELMNESMNIFQATGNTWWQAMALNFISTVGEERSGDAQSVRVILHEISRLWRKAGDKWCESIPIMAWGQFALRHGDFIEAQDSLRRSLEICRQFGPKGITTQVLRDLGHVARALREFDQAEVYYEECLIYYREIGYATLLAEINGSLGFVLLHQGEAGRAEQFFIQAERQAQEIESQQNLILCLAGFAALHVVRGKPASAVPLFGAVSALVKANQIQVSVVDQNEIDHYLELCRAQVEKTGFDQAWSAGCGMTLDQASAYVHKSIIW